MLAANLNSQGPVAARRNLDLECQRPRTRASSVWIPLKHFCRGHVLSQQGRAISGRFLQTSQTDEASAAEDKARVRLAISVWIGQLPSTTNPARMIADTSVSHPSGFLLAQHNELPDSSEPCGKSEMRETFHLRTLLWTSSCHRQTDWSHRSTLHRLIDGSLCPEARESSIHFGSKTMQHATKPNVEEVHEVGIWDGIVVRRVGDDDVQ